MLQIEICLCDFSHLGGILYIQCMKLYFHVVFLVTWDVDLTYMLKNIRYMDGPPLYILVNKHTFVLTKYIHFVCFGNHVIGVNYLLVLFVINLF